MMIPPKRKKIPQLPSELATPDAVRPDVPDNEEPLGQDEALEAASSSTGEEPADAVRPDVPDNEEPLGQDEAHNSTDEEPVATHAGTDRSAEDETVDIGTFSRTTARQYSNPCSRGGPLNVINSARNGKRITIANAVLNALDAGNQISVRLKPNSILLMAATDSDFVYTGRVQPTKTIFYSGQLVEEVTGILDLDFTRRVSITFTKIRYSRTAEGQLVAIISL